MVEICGNSLHPYDISFVLISVRIIQQSINKITFKRAMTLDLMFYVAYNEERGVDSVLKLSSTFLFKFPSPLSGRGGKV